MKKIALLLFLFSGFTLAQEESEPLNIINDLFNSTRTEQVLGNVKRTYASKAAIERVENHIATYGELINHKCYINSDAEMLVGIVCHVKQKLAVNGSAWQFLLFKDAKNWVGTNIMISELLAPNEKCVKNVKPVKGNWTYLAFEEVECNA